MKIEFIRKTALQKMVEEIKIEILAIEKIKSKKILELVYQEESDLALDDIQGYLYLLDGEIIGLKMSLEKIKKYL